MFTKSFILRSCRHATNSGLLMHTDTSQPTDGSTVEQQGVLAWGLISSPLTHASLHSPYRPLRREIERGKRLQRGGNLHKRESPLHWREKWRRTKTLWKQNTLVVCVSLCVHRQAIRSETSFSQFKNIKIGNKDWTELQWELVVLPSHCRSCPSCGRHPWIRQQRCSGCLACW